MMAQLSREGTGLKGLAAEARVDKLDRERSAQFAVKYRRLQDAMGTILSHTTPAAAYYPCC